MAARGGIAPPPPRPWAAMASARVAVMPASPASAAPPLPAASPPPSPPVSPSTSSRPEVLTPTPSSPAFASSRPNSPALSSRAPSCIVSIAPPPPAARRGPPPPPPPPPVASVGRGRYKLIERIGAGGFAQVFRGLDMDNEELVAVKLEDYEDELQALQLEDEAELLRSITWAERPEGFAAVLCNGDEGHYHYMVTALLGDPVSALVDRPEGPRPMSQAHVALLAEQMISRLAVLHSKGIVHRDVKPENFVFGRECEANHIYLIDFGLSRRYFEKGHHIPMRNGLTPRGTLRYASVNVLKGIEASRRDDLEALGYVLVYLTKGSLPWSGLGPFAVEDFPKMRRRIFQTKEEIPLSDLCSGLDGGFEAFLREVRQLKFDERPNYTRLRRHFYATSKRAAGDALPWLPGTAEQQRMQQPGLLPLEPWREPRQPDQVHRKSDPSKGAAAKLEVLQRLVCAAFCCEGTTPGSRIDEGEEALMSMTSGSLSSSASSGRSGRSSGSSRTRTENDSD